MIKKPLIAQLLHLADQKKKEEEVKKALFSSADCAVMQQDLGLSNSQTKIQLRDIRLATGSQKVIEKNAFMMIQGKNHRLDTFFELSKLVYRLEEKNTKIIKNMEFPTIVCSDPPGLINKVTEKRQREKDSVLIKISTDGGGEFLKICASVFDIDNPILKMSGALSKTFPKSGVKKNFTIGLVPDVPEDYVNVKWLWTTCGVEHLRNYTVATDLKLCNILLGMMNHSSCHPCAWYGITKEALHKKGNQRTISSLMNLFWDFFESRNEKSEAKKFGNVIHPPILCDNIDNETPVIFLLPQPVLHLLIEPVNKMYAALESLWPDSKN